MKVKEIFFQTADVSKGIWLMLLHGISTFLVNDFKIIVYFHRRYATDMLYVKVIKGMVYVSDHPFGSKWLTSRSNVWRCGSKETNDLLSLYDNDIYIYKKPLKLRLIPLK